MISQLLTPTGVLGLRQCPDTTLDWGVSGDLLSELHQRDPPELLPAAGVLAVCLPIWLGFMGKCTDMLDGHWEKAEGLVPRVREHLFCIRGAEGGLMLQPAITQDTLQQARQVAGLSAASKGVQENTRAGWQRQEKGWMLLAGSICALRVAIPPTCPSREA